MGALPNVTFLLQNATPYQLLYLMTANSIGATTLPNASGVTPDLSTDALTAAALNPNGLPLFQLLQTICATQLEARWVMFGGGTQPNSASQPGGSPHSFNRARRARVEITPVGAGADLFWAVDALQDPSGNLRPALSVQVDGVIAGEDDQALLRIHYDHPKYSGLNLGSS